MQIEHGPHPEPRQSPAMLRLARRAAKAALRASSHPPVGHRRIASDLHALGVRRGGILLVHSSLSAIGHVVGGPEAVIRGLGDALGPEGTLVLPTHTWDQMEAGCRIFDVRGTRVCVGVIPEVFRGLAGVRRSLHPTHSVAASGPLARCLLEAHEMAETPCGEGTPYDRILGRDGQILLLGCGMDSNTCFHTTESIAGVPYLMREQREEFVLIDEDGCRRAVRLRRHRAGVPRRFGAFEGLLTGRGIARVGRVGGARAILLDGGRFKDHFVRALRDDPGLLLATTGPVHAAQGGIGT